MQTGKWLLTKEPDELARTLRMLSASVNVAILRELVRARRRGEGWMYLSEIAAALGESPGTVAHGLAKLAPLLEERRAKGLRYFRANFGEVRLEFEKLNRA